MENSSSPKKQAIGKEIVISRYMENNRKQYNLASSKENMDMLYQKQKGELSSVLFDLKTEHDQMALESLNKTQEAELLKKKIGILELNAKKSSNSFKHKSQFVSSMESLINEKKVIQLEEKQCHHLFRNKIEKLSKDILIIHQETKALENQTRKLDKQIELGNFNSHSLKTKLNTAHMKVTNQNEVNKQSLEEQELQKGYYLQIIEQKNSFALSAEERKIRQQIAADKAKNNTDDLNEIIMRRKCLLLKLYNHYLAKKMHNELELHEEVEHAFIQIRDLSGTGNFSEIADFILTKDKSYNLKQEQVSLNEKKKSKLRSQLQVLIKKNQEMLSQVIVNPTSTDNTQQIEAMKISTIEEKDKELLNREKALLEKLDTSLEVQKNVNLKYEKTIGNMKHLIISHKHHFSSMNDNKGPSEFNSANNTVNNNATGYDSSNNTGINFDNNNTFQKEIIDTDNEEKAFNEYILFLKNSFETFNRLFLCYSKQDFLNMMKEREAAKKTQQGTLLKKNKSKPILKLALNTNSSNNKTNIRRKSRPLLQSFSTTDILKKNPQFGEEEDDISQRKQQTQREIMRNFLQDIKKEREEFIKSIKPLP